MHLKKACSAHPWMISRFTVLLCAWLCCPSVFAADITTPASLPVIGHAPTATNLTITNNSAPGLNPAMDDSLEAHYTIVDADGDVASVTSSIWAWQADGAAIDGATTSIFTPAPAQYKQFLSFSVTPSTEPAITDPALGMAPVTSPRMKGPVLPPRADLAGEYTDPAIGNWFEADAACTALGLRLPTLTELQATFVTYTRANALGESSYLDIVNTYDWPTSALWTNSPTVGSRNEFIYLHEDGRSSYYSSTINTYYVCKK